MAKTPFETLTKLEKIKPKADLQRRNSTGGAAIFNEPIPIPNYLRASIGSCHDLCKYGKRLDSPPQKSELRRNINLKLAEAKSNTNDRAKKVSESQNLNTNDRGKKVPESKILGFPSSRKKPYETLKSTCNARAGQKSEIKKRSSPLPRTPSPSPAQPSAKIPVSKTRRSMSLPRKIGPAKPLERPERHKKPERESVEEKIIDVIEAKDENQHVIVAKEENQHVIEAEDEKQNEGFVSSLDQKQEMDSEGNDSKVEVEREEEVLERENKDEDDEEEGVSEEKRVLRRAISEGDFDNNKEKESVRIVVQMGKDKVKALVHAFETLITT